ncbi:ABC transporter permease [Jiella sonneratiae]|uniref:ABC transporter permease n=1 Tax=Jiella sonneratiae TaxID=2816856 RepID=A0ABS3J3K2_9HYPH|nr:ABC transporter permease [Jiella sonneratiae]MBO0904245.1 ABC transporter permease [Jiella sonneratiae]
MGGFSIRKAVLGAIVVLLCAVMLAPIVIVAVVSFSGDAYLKFPPELYSLEWYERFLGNARWTMALWNSVLVAAITCICSTALAFLAAYGMIRGNMPFRRVITALLLMPLIVPHVVTAVALYFLSARFGMIGVRPWIALAHSVIALPVVLIILQSALKTVDVNLERAAMICGCNRFGVFHRVVLPLTAPAIISSLLFAFLTSFDELVISLFLAGIRAETLPVRMWNSLMLQVEPTIAAVSTLLIVVTSTALLAEWALRRRTA